MGTHTLNNPCEGFSPGCVARTVWSAGGGLSTASAASDSDAEAGRCACPHVLQKRSPTSVLLPQFPKNISRCLARLVRSGELGMIHHEVRVLHGQHCSFVGTAAGPTDFARSFGGTGAVRSATGADIRARDFGHRQRLSTSGGLGYDGGLAEGGSSSSYRTGFLSLSRPIRWGCTTRRFGPATGHQHVCVRLPRLQRQISGRRSPPGRLRWCHSV